MGERRRSRRIRTLIAIGLLVGVVAPMALVTSSPAAAAPVTPSLVANATPRIGPVLTETTGTVVLAGGQDPRCRRHR